jgi:N utilization substance protein A
VREVGLGPRGPQILLSRTTEYLLKHLFEAEIPEIAEGSVVIKSIAREAGGRSKIAVAAVEQNTDPVGACIGQRGTRIQTIIAEVAGEKIDIIEWSEDIADFVAQALAPAKVGQVVINEEEHLAVVSVAPDQLSLAIGRGGQNVRLASKLTNWRVNIAEDGTGTLPAVEAEAEAPEEAAAEVAAE